MRCPGHRKADLAIADLHHVIDTEHATRGQYPCDLGHQPGLVGDVHADMEHHAAVKCGIIKWHVQGAAMVQRDPPDQIAPLGQFCAGGDEVRGQVDSGDVTADGGGHRAGRPASTATDVNHAAVRRDLQPAAEPAGRFNAADMKFVIGGEDVRRQ